MTMTDTCNRDAEVGVLAFPNPSRSYDAMARGVNFWGYDRTIEVSFFIETDALSKLSPATKADEPGFLNTFDTNRNRIYEAAASAYSRRRKASYIFSYTLTDSDF